MADPTALEFTGERVVPGQVTPDLWSEHFSRYAFARQLVHHMNVVDAGCGTGYGSAELALSARNVIGVDVSEQAVEYARSSFPIANVRFEVASCIATGLPDGSADAVIAFEVIEHLPLYREFLDECVRVLQPEGFLIVSTPNKEYYAESRVLSGPNPFHEHEFEPQEFADELRRVFPNVHLLAQNRVDAFAFHPVKAYGAAEACIAEEVGDWNDAHFLIAICSRAALPAPKSFVYVPEAGNLLRVREKHIALLEKQLSEVRSERDELLALYHAQSEELDERTRWAQKLDRDIGEIAAGYERKVKELEAEGEAKTQWARGIDAQLAECARVLHEVESTLDDRTQWAQRLDHERMLLEQQLNAARASRWIRLGRRLGVGPALEQG